MLWLEHCVTPSSRQGKVRISGRTLDQDGGKGKGGGVWFRRGWEAQDMVQNSDHNRKYVKGIDFLGMSETLISMT